MASNKKYWKSVEELNENSSIVEKLQKSEFVEDLPTDKFLGDKESLESGDTSRRDFLKYSAILSAAAASPAIFSSCAIDPVTGQKQLMLMSREQEVAIDRDGFVPVCFQR